MPRKYDPLKCIPSSAAVRTRLEETRELERKLGVLLETAERLEANQTVLVGTQESHPPDRAR